MALLLPEGIVNGTITDTVEAIRAYTDAGWKIIPVRNKRDNGKEAKTPLISKWPEKATTDMNIIDGWLNNFKQLMTFALPAGQDRTVSVDTDINEKTGEDAGRKSFLNFCKENKFEVDTAWQTTPSGGAQYLFRVPENLDITKIKNKVKRFPNLKFCDSRTVGGYFLVAPSKIGPYNKGKTPMEGGQYQWQEGKNYIQEMPEFLYNELASAVSKENAPKVKAGGQVQAATGDGFQKGARLVVTPPNWFKTKAEGILKLLKDCESGERNNTVFLVGCGLGEIIKEGGCTREYAEQLIRAEYSHLIDASFKEDEAEQAMKNGIDKGLSGELTLHEIKEKKSKKINNKSNLKPTSAICLIANEKGEMVEPKREWVEDNRAIVQYSSGMLKECGEALAFAVYQHFYNFGSTIVRIVKLKEEKVLKRNKEGQKLALIPKGSTVTEILDAKKIKIWADTVLRWQKYSKKEDDWVECPAPLAVAEYVYEFRQSFNFRNLLGIANCPIIFPDGRILDKEGYDEESGLLVDFCGVAHYSYNGIKFNKETARTYSAILYQALAEFPFKTGNNGVDISVAVAAIFTAVIRKVIAKAPMFAFNANVPGTGKSTLCDVAGITATGKVPASIRWNDDHTEMNKELFATVLEGAQVVVIDNANNVKVNDPTLAQAVERETLKGRILGKSENGEAPSNALWMINGNHMTIVEDMRRRVLLCNLDSLDERPERHDYKNKDFYNWIAEKRRDLVAAVIIILKSYIEEGRPDIDKLSPYTDYQEWSDFVRAPIVWLGLEDPIKSQDTMAKVDPIRTQLGAVLASWHKIYGESVRTVKQLFDERNKFEGGTLDFNNRGSDNILFQALDELPRRGELNATFVGQYLSRHEGETVDGLRLVKSEMKTRDGKTLFAVVKNK